MYMLVVLFLITIDREKTFNVGIYIIENAGRHAGAPIFALLYDIIFD